MIDKNKIDNARLRFINLRLSLFGFAGCRVCPSVVSVAPLYLRILSAELLSMNLLSVDLLSVDPGLIRNHMSAAVTDLLHAVHCHSAGNRTEHTLKVDTNHAFVLRVHSGGVHLK